MFSDTSFTARTPSRQDFLGAWRYFSEGIDISVVDRGLGDDRRSARADCLVGDHLIRFISVYAPNHPNERRIFFETLGSMLDIPGDIVLGGDFDCVLSSSDRSSSANRENASAATLRDLLRENDLVNVTPKFPVFTPRYGRKALTQDSSGSISPPGSFQVWDGTMGKWCPFQITAL